MSYRILFVVVAGFLVISLAYAEVPKQINFQGRLTDASGKFVPDGNYSLTFRIYTDSTGGSYKWQEAQLIAVSKGLFNVILGSISPIPDSIFNYTDTWLGIQVGLDPEMTPRQRLSSLGYSYRTAKADTSSYSMDSDKLDGYDASNFIGTVSDYGRSGVASDLYESTTTLTDKYVNEGQANSVSSSMITDEEIVDNDISPSAGISASKINDGSGSGLDADLLDGQEASSFLTISSDYGRSGVSDTLYESTITLTDKYVNEQGPDSVVGSSGTAFTGYVSGSSSSPLQGIQGYATNNSTGNARGGYFYASSLGSGTHTGVLAEAHGSSSAYTYGIKGYSANNSNGATVGGYFFTSSTGTGEKYGIKGDGFGASSSPVYGISSSASNTSDGNAIGGYFRAQSSGTGIHYGIIGYGYGSTSANTYGTYNSASNTSSGDAYGGFFSTLSTGGGNHYGIMAEGYANSAVTTYGSYGYAENTSSGGVYAGYFETDSLGTGTHYGVLASGFGTSSASTFGIYGRAENTSSGFAYAGRFNTNGTGTGIHYGIYTTCYGNSSSTTEGVYSFAYNSSSGNVYAGHFIASSAGTGTKYGVYASAPAAEGYAGYFSGNFLATGGTKSAAVKVDNGEYHLLYSMESPENWFEDFGGGTLSNGTAIIQIDPLFAQTVNTQIEYRVYLTPEGDCKGLYVSNKTPSSFEVRELQGGVSSIPFSYRIVAKRKGYEDLRLSKMIGPTPEEMEIQQAKRVAEAEQERLRMDQEKSGREKEREEMKTEHQIKSEMNELDEVRARKKEEEHSRMEADILRMEKEREEERKSLDKGNDSKIK